MKKKNNNKIAKTQKTSNNRGRPKKEFISKKPLIKRDGPGRPKKEDQIKRFLPKTNIAREDNKTKDGIILWIFIFSLALFWFSLYVSQTKKIKEDTLIQQTITELKQIASGNKTGLPETGNIQKSIENQKPLTVVPETREGQIIQTFYGQIRNQQRNEIYISVDNKLKQSSIFQTYFSRKRLERFVNNLNKPNIQITINEVIPWDIPTVKYTINYQIKDGTAFTEQRDAALIKKDDTYKIGKIRCETTGCVKMPFFNPTKYGIK